MTDIQKIHEEQNRINMMHGLLFGFVIAWSIGSIVVAKVILRRLFTLQKLFNQQAISDEEKLQE